MTGHPPRVTVVGAGITGLAAAWELCTRGAAVTILEASSRLGGKLASREVAGVVVDTGPDAFLARGTAAVSLCEELGIELVAPRVSSALVWTRGRLRPLPDGLVLGFPTKLWPLMHSGIVSLPGMVRAGLDLVIPTTRLGEDFSVAEAVTPRLGREVTARLVEPLLGGIHAGTAAGLSLPEVAPTVAAAVSRSRSAIRALRTLPTPPTRATSNSHAASPTAGRPPVFLTPRGGLHLLASRLVEELVERGVEIRTRAPVRSLTSLGDDPLVLALPAHAAAPLVAALDRNLGSELFAIHHASVVVVTLAYPAGSLPDSLPGTGFLSPRQEGRLMTATTWLSTKWDHYRPSDLCLARVSVGRIDDTRHREFGDHDLAVRAHDELAEAMSTIHLQLPPPLATAVNRWSLALPQYGVGHRARVERIERAAVDLPGLHLAGNYLHGVGVPACIESGRAAARAAAGG